MNKNISGYCGYIGLISFVVYRPDNGLLMRDCRMRQLHRRTVRNPSPNVAEKATGSPSADIAEGG